MSESENRPSIDRIFASHERIRQGIDPTNRKIDTRRHTPMDRTYTGWAFGWRLIALSFGNECHADG